MKNIIMVVRITPQGTVKDCWDGGWSPSLAAQLSDQRLEEFLSMQQMLEGWRPREGDVG